MERVKHVRYFKILCLVSLVSKLNINYYVFLVWYRESLPIEAAPSYRGTSVKYSYKVTIATQKVGSHIKMVRIPFRVLPISPIMNMQDLAALCGNETTEELQPTNPFSEERKVETPLTMALQVLQVVI